MYITITILLITAIFFMSGKVRSDLVAMCALISLVVFQILTPKEALAGFSSTIVIMMIALFVVGGAIFQTGLAKMIGSKIIAFSKGNELTLMVLVMCVTAFFSAFVSNTGTVALMMPIIMSITLTNPTISAPRLLMPLAFASSMGGVVTLIGTPPNLVINDALINAGHKALSFFSFTPVGIIGLIVGILYLIPASKLLIKDAGKTTQNKTTQNKTTQNKTLNELALEYKLSHNLFRVLVQEGSPLHNKSVKEIFQQENYNLQVLEISREPISVNPLFKTTDTKQVNAHTVVQQGDVLYLQGSFTAVEALAQHNNLKILTQNNQEDTQTLHFENIGITEVLVMPEAKIVESTVKNSRLRENFGLNILGIQRKNQYLLENLKNQIIRPADILLVQGSWEKIAALAEERRNLIVLGNPLTQASKVSLTRKAPLVAIIMLLMICAMVFDFIPIDPVIAVIIAAILMVIIGALPNVEAAYQTINWESIVLIAAMLPMATALEKTGVSHLVSKFLADELGNLSPYALMLGIYFITSIMTMFISNTATAVLISPIAFEAAQNMGLMPHSFLFAVAVAASMCFAAPFSSPPNALVMSAGRYTFNDYLKIGLPLQIILGIIMVMVLPLLFPF